MKESANDMCCLVIILTVKDTKLVTLLIFTVKLSLAYLEEVKLG